MEYKRILIKLSGEVLAGKEHKGIDLDALNHYIEEITQVYHQGYQVIVVIGGGNIYRGKEGEQLGLPTVPSDHMGMLATMMNAVALSTKLSQKGIDTRIMSRLPMPRVAETYNAAKALRILSKGYLLILGGGTGVPCFTSDSAGTLTAIELEADLFVKGTYVDGVFSEDPIKNPSAQYYDQLSIQEAIDKKLQVLDMTAMMLCLSNKMPIVVYNATVKGRLLQAIETKTASTLLYP